MTTPEAPLTANLSNAPASASKLLEMRGITKRFPGVVANDGIDFDVLRGEVHTLLGENGAGKSTLMKILFGLYRPDEGQILLEGKPLEIDSPSDAIAQRIGMIHQHFMLVPTITVVENVALGLASGRGPLTDLDTVAARIEEISSTYGLAVDPWVEVWKLSVGERQRVEIIKALYRDAQLLVLDEPTAVLTPQEVDDLFVILHQMKEAGRGLIFISHKLHEVMVLSDRVTVLRNGRVTGHTTPQESSRHDLAELMVGRAVKLAPDKPAAEPGEDRLLIRGLSITDDSGNPAVRSLDLAVRSGEIVGIAGVSGNGQRELAEAVIGLRAPAQGSIEVSGQQLVGADPAACRAAGLAYVPEERMKDGAIGEFSVSENLVLVDFNDAQFAQRGFLRFGEIKDHCQRLVDAFRVKTPTLDTPTDSLSGGNIQKIILARELATNPSVLLAAQPTRGVDIGAAEYIHERLIEKRGEGMATLLISEDLDEVFGLADRIAVMFEGEIMAIVNPDDVTREEVGLLMAGVADPVGA